MAADKKNNNIYSQLYKITEEYFGPATERFLDSAIESKLRKPPSKLVKLDIPELADWLTEKLTIVSNDNIAVNNYINKVRRLKRD